MVVVPHVPSMLRQATYDAVYEQTRGAAVFLADPGGGLFYADLLRGLWHEPGELIVVEQDVVPPPGSLQALHDCPALWCGHMLPFQGGVNSGTLGLAKFSAECKRVFPLLFDFALARPPWLKTVACLKAGEVDPYAAPDMRDWPSSVGWPRCDIMIRRELEVRGARWHCHEPAPTHLHDWPGGPVSVKADLTLLVSAQ